MRNTGIAYLLWCTGFFGLAGIHRLYSGKYVTGVIWLFTLGLCGVGQFIDLFLIPGMVENKNLKYQLLHATHNNASVSQQVVINVGEQVTSATSQAKAIAEKKSDLQTILQLAKDNYGNVSLVDCVLATEKPVEQVRKTLESLCVDGLLEIDNHQETGAIIYRII
ncbi:NINE protein [Microcoleus sp. FACHB-SPT15]|jgi:TM2 domain-containing membrane protein YozV|uniref:NINE protein n=1 Tax=Microcoleus sp. FACHB-SPT15 TaxID=2692830 RepID=UPI00177B9EC2|nr:NINE protein [Microcoleus sp. FACHB-SPT15]MBD1804024.1 NINE protein [Microcoleus sp. FACHB-SPT15]